MSFGNNTVLLRDSVDSFGGHSNQASYHTLVTDICIYNNTIMQDVLSKIENKRKVSHNPATTVYLVKQSQACGLVRITGVFNMQAWTTGRDIVLTNSTSIV